MDERYGSYVCNDSRSPRQPKGELKLVEDMKKIDRKVGLRLLRPKRSMGRRSGPQLRLKDADRR